MRTLTIAQMTLRAGFLIELVLGILFWTNVVNPDTSMAVKNVHMLIGIIVVLSLWTIGLAQGFMKGSNDFGLALLTFIVGLAVAAVGLFQTNWLQGSQHWIIQVIHLLLGLAAIGTGEMVAGIAKRRVKAAGAAA